MICALCAALGAAAAQTPPLPPIHPLGPVEHQSKELLGAVSAARALPGGRVLINDNIGRKVALFDETLGSYTVVADTTSATANAYSSRAGGLFAYKGDTSLFVDPTSLSMLVIDGAGKVIRVMAVPRPNDAGSLIGGQTGNPGFDAQGRLVYRAQSQLSMPKRDASGVLQVPVFPDSAALVRIDLETRKLDTVGFLRIQKINLSMAQTANGGMSMTTILNPMQIIDDWAVMTDGSIALVRGRDYHIDWVLMDGKLAAAPKIPFAWRHLDDSAKVAFIDSTKAAMEKLREQQNARLAAGGNAPMIMGPPDGGGGGGGMRVEMKVGGGGDGPPPRGNPPANGAAANSNQLPPLQFVPPSDLPDYAPAFSAGGSARADLDGNLWIRTSNVVAGGSVYDVINGKGELVDRIQVPAGRVIAGFGKGGIVYMGVREGTGVRLEQARRKWAT
jgi:hypothetical protein